MAADALADIDISEIKDLDLKLVAVLMKSEFRLQRTAIEEIKKQNDKCKDADTVTHKDLYEKVGTLRVEVAKHGLVFGVLGSVLVLVTNFVLGLVFRRWP